MLKFWEPNAPSFEERLRSLKYAYDKGYKTSISIEPFLDKDPYVLVEKLMPFTSKSIWIGKMNYVSINNLMNSERSYYNKIKQNNSKENLLKIIEKARKYNQSFLKIKDSIFNDLK